MYLLIHLGFNSIQYGVSNDVDLIERYIQNFNNFNEDNFKKFIAKNKKKNILKIYVTINDRNSIYYHLIEFVKNEIKAEFKIIKKNDISIDIDPDIDLTILDIDVLISFWYAKFRNKNLIIIFKDKLVRVFLFQNNAIKGGITFLSTDLQIKTLVQNFSNFEYFDKVNYPKTLICKNKNELLSSGIFENQALMFNEVVSKYNIYANDAKGETKVLIVSDDIEEKVEKQFKFQYIKHSMYIIFAMKNFATFDNESHE